MNKKMMLSVLGIVAVSASAALGGTTPGSGVVGSIHDMNQYTGATQDTQGRVCAFCHTPHHALTEGNDYLPLWSHQLPSTTYIPYASATIDATITQATMMDGPSKLCMSCHDGAVAVDTHYATTANKTLTSDAFGAPAVGLEGSLNNDHPIGFVFDQSDGGVANGPVTGNPPVSPSDSTQNNGPSGVHKDNWIRQKAATYIGNTTLTIADRLYATSNGPIMTCATCHDVHNKKNVDVVSATSVNYLLLSPNAGSQICLTCHIK
ncbi:hypothetical protein [Geomonas ferrireducens]|uniref:hypothetical protein n=1 Tax=Geomonas ferrireducens TaxID=2570227 RepID=UPI0010A9461F|nr:hypothetical protein [Geomonas ferrireducens]